MILPPFLLDHWLNEYEFASPPIAYNLATSTGPCWTLGELLNLEDDGLDALHGTKLSYALPQGSPVLRAAIADFHGVDPEWVVVATGASEALSILFCLAAKPGAGVAAPAPAFPAFDAVAAAWGLKPQPYVLHPETGFAQRADEILRVVDRDTALVLVNTPHNPTGSVMKRSETQRLASALADRRIPLVIDEVYHPIYFDNPEPTSAGIENVIVVGDLSKALSLPGLRVGWLIDADPVRRKAAIDARSYFTISTSPILESLAVRALKNRSVLIDRLGSAARANHTALGRFMEQQNAILTWSPPQGGTVAFPGFMDGRNTRALCTTLARRGVLLAPGDCFGRPDRFRIGLGAQETGFDSGLAIMAETLDEVDAKE